MRPYRILVCGGRDFGKIPSDEQRRYLDASYVRQKEIERDFIRENLNAKLTKAISFGGEIIIIAGGAPGADTVAEEWARENGCLVEVFPADWNTHGKSAGFIRNSQMLKEGKPDLVMAFPGGKGTRMMCDLAEKAGVRVNKYTL